MRLSRTFTIRNTLLIRKQLANWCNRSDVFAFHNSNGFNLKQTNASLFPEYDILAATGAIETLSCNHGNVFNSLRDFIAKKRDWYFGIMAYDLKNETEKLTSSKANFPGFQDLYFFRPHLVFRLKNTQLEIMYESEIYTDNLIDNIFEDISGIKDTIEHNLLENVRILQRISKKDYLTKLDSIKAHIARGDIFEMNFCVEFYAENTKINPLVVYMKLMELSPAPYSCFCRINDKYIISSSPERYLAKRADLIISQPMKGTIKRGTTSEYDEKLIMKLKKNPKEISENIMIVDLVRNDLSRIALKDSVKVEELCGIYTYNTVHQMVSTVSCRLANGFDSIDVIKNTFPMGSMTGAPKVRAMQLIEEYEESRRGVYSGTAGFFTPQGDFDFNVIIRTILYNETNRYLSFTTGGAITASSRPGDEYQECVLKAEAMKKALINH